MQSYRHVIFDLDHTLWDFTANSNATLEELYLKYDLNELGFTLTDFLSVYQEVNDTMWTDYRTGIITKEDIREKRFKITLNKLGVQADPVAERVNEDYLAICPSKGFVVSFAHEILHYLRPRYVLHILTNGFKEIQQVKLSTSGLDQYFSEVVNSEEAGFLKPDKRVFEFTLAKIRAESDECIMVGDDLIADVLGAQNAGIAPVFFNRKNLRHNEQDRIAFEIKCLSELRRIL